MAKQGYNPKSSIARWLDARFPLFRFMYDKVISFPVPRNLNYFYTFGGILTLVFISQILTGLVMAMHYVPDTHLAFASRQHFMRDGAFGWLFAPWHAVGASFFFIAAYIHIARGLYYGSYKKPREVVWIFGIFIYLLMMAISFFGYVLVWGMMSTTAAGVISSFFKQVPFCGEWIYETFVGGYSIGEPTLNRFYVWHYALAFLLVFFVFLHVIAIHQVGQTNPTGVEISSEEETMPFAPYALIKDLFAISVFLIFFSWFLFYMPDYMGAPDNYVLGDPMKTSLHIMPEWYFLPFYAMLRAITFDIGPISSTTAGVFVLFFAIVLLFFVPWLDRSPVRSARYRPIYKIFFWAFLADVVFLGYLGAQEITPHINFYAQCATLFYFCFFLVVLPLLPYVEKTKQQPSSVLADIKENHQTRGRLW